MTVKLTPAQRGNFTNEEVMAFMAERDRLRAVNAELVKALEHAAHIGRVFKLPQFTTRMEAVLAKARGW